jgi:excisionase family DNA binding protein
MASEALLAAAAELDRRLQERSVGDNFQLSRELVELAARLRHVAGWLSRPANELCRCHSNSADAAGKRGDGQQPIALTSREAATLLRVSERTLARMTAAEELRPVRRGRSVRYSRADLEAWLTREEK